MEKGHFTWASSQYLAEPFNQPPMALSGNSIRQTIHTSVGGAKIRLKFSNLVGKTELAIDEVHIAKTITPAKIAAATDCLVTFNGKTECTIPAGEELWSDVIDFSFTALECLTVTTCFKTVPVEITGHMGSRTHSYIMEGKHLCDESFNDEFNCEHWYFLAAIGVEDGSNARIIACLGDSITDGRGSTTDLQNRWTDILSERLLHKEETKDCAVINQGIGGTCMMFSGVERFNRDVLEQEGVAYCFIFYGINDIIYVNATTEKLIETYKSLISRAREKGLKVYGGTILPFGNCNDFTAEKDKIRREVNNWILTTPASEGGFDKTIDLSTVIADPTDDSKMNPAFDCGDGLHPSAEGYKTIGNAFDLKWF